MKVQANWSTIAAQQVVQRKKKWHVDQEKMKQVVAKATSSSVCRRNELQSNGPDLLINF